MTLPLPPGAEDAPLPARLRARGLLEGQPLARAAACLQAARDEPEAAVAHLERAWTLGLRDPAILRLLCGAVESLPQAVRIAGHLRDRALEAAQSGTAGEFTQAVLEFQGFAIRHRLPVQEGWLEGAIRRRLPPAPPSPAPPGPPLLVHVVPQPLDPTSTLPPLAVEIAALQRDPRLRSAVFIPAEEAACRAANPRLFALAAEAGVALHPSRVQRGTPALARLLLWREELMALGASAVCFHFNALEDGLLAALRPAPLVVGWDHGHPEWYTSPFLDLAFGTHPHGAVEARCPVAFLPLGLTRRHDGVPGALSRSALGLPDGVPLLMTSGSPDKLRSPALRALLQRLLSVRPGLHLLILGDGEAPPPEGCEGRWHARGRRQDFAAVLALCDAYMDTVPVGGGLAIAEAMRQGVPCALMHHPMDRIFDKLSGFAAFSYLAADEAIAVRAGDLEALAARALAMLEDAAQRAAQLARQASLLGLITDPARQVARMEEAVLGRLQGA